MAQLAGLMDEDLFFEEEQMYLHASLDDMRFARSMLRRLGNAERRRFSETGFAYGDPSLYGGHPYEVYEAQLCNVLYTLFGDGFGAEFFSVSAMDGEQEETLKEIVALDGGPVRVEEQHYFAGGDYEEILLVQISTCDDPERDSVATDPAVTTACERLRMLITALRAAAGEGRPPQLYRWRPGAEWHRKLYGGYEQRYEHVLLVFGWEPYAPHDFMHDFIFERFIRAWRWRNRREAPARSDPELAASNSDTGDQPIDWQAEWKAARRENGQPQQTLAEVFLGQEDNRRQRGEREGDG